MTTSTISRKGKAALKKLWVPCLWLLLWQGASLAVDEALLLPAPGPVLLRMWGLLFTRVFWSSALHSLGRVALGFLLGLALGGALAAASARWRPVEEFLSPAMAAVKATPVASFIILALVWISGSGLSVFISFLMVLPLSWQNVRQGIAAADPQLLEVARVYRFSPGATARAVYLPALLPHLLSAARVGLGFAWKAGIAGEVIAISSGSIGYRLYTAKTTLAMEDLFAWTGFILLLSFLLERGMVALMGLAARRLAPEPGKGAAP